MPTYHTQYIVLDKHKKIIADGKVAMRGKSKKDLANFILSRKFLQLEEGEKIIIEAIVTQ